MNTTTETAALLAFVKARLAGAANPLDVAMDAAWPGLPAGITLEQARRRTSAALVAVGIDDTNLILRQTIALYERELELIATLAGEGYPSSHAEAAAESYLNVIRLHAARWAIHQDYRPEFRHGWMDELPA